MVYLTEIEAVNLLNSAKEACEHTYSPYSEFAVGAAVLTFDGKIYKGSNIENASYSLTICAERVAVGNAFSSGQTKIKAIAVWSDTNSISPCGACRQFLIEFGKDIVVVFFHNQEIIQKTIDELLPFGFTRSNLA